MFGDDEQAQDSKPPRRRRGLRHPDEDPYRHARPATRKHCASFETELELELEDASHSPASGPRTRSSRWSREEDNKLYDLHNVKYRGFVASERLAGCCAAPAWSCIR